MTYTNRASARSAIAASGELVWPSAAALAQLTFLLPRVARDVTLAGDSGELVAAAAGLGVPHAPGFPAYVGIGHIFSRLPFGSLAFRLNAMSAVAHALVVFFIVATARRLGLRPVAALAAAVAIGLSTTFVRASLYAEVFPLVHLLVIVLLFLAMEDPAKHSGSGLALFAAVAGIASATHPFVVLTLPAFAYLLGPSAVRLALSRRWLPLAWLGSFALPFLGLYGLLGLLARRDPFVSWGDAHSATAILHLFLRTDYGGVLSASRHAAELPLWPRLTHWAMALAASFGPLALLVAGAGVFARGWAHARHVGALLLLFVAVGPAFALMNGLFARTDEGHVALVERFITISIVPLALLVGFAVEGGLARWAARLPQAPRHAAWAIPLALAFVKLPSAARQDRSTSRVAHAFIEDLLRGVPNDAVLVVTGDVYAQALAYGCGVEKRCNRLVVVQPGLLFSAWYRTQMERRYPDLGSFDGARATRDAHVLLERWARTRPIYVQPQVLANDAELWKLFSPEPRLLLFRLMQPAASPSNEAFLRFASELLDGGGCAGCSLRASDLDHPAMEIGILIDYRNALINMADAASARRLPELALRLRESAEAIDSPSP